MIIAMIFFFLAKIQGREDVYFLLLIVNQMSSIEFDM